MRFKIYIFLFQQIMFYELVHFAKSMVGEDIREARVNEFPFIVAIMRKCNATTSRPEDYLLGTGTLITPTHVLTAGHNKKYLNTSDVEIIVGSVDLRNHGEYKKFDLLWWVDYNEWAKHNKEKVRYVVNDVAVFKMNGAASSSIRLPELSQISHKDLYGKYVATAGWGKNNEGVISRYLQTASLKILSNKDCEDKLERTVGNKIPIHRRLFCGVGQKFLLLQFGDSGAPILLDNVVVAIQKSSAPYPHLEIHPDKVNIHTSVSYYRKFITDIISSSRSWA